MTTPDECLDALREAADRLGKSPSKAEYEQLELTPSASTILRHHGSWNEAKERAGLGTSASSGSRLGDKPEHVTLPEGESWEDLSQDQRWHYKNREWNTERTLARRQEHRKWIRTLKRESNGCRQCGESDPRCLDFHHRKPSEKAMAINKMVLYGYSKSRIRAEIEKCELLCANCHARFHRTKPGEEILITVGEMDLSSGKVTEEILGELEEVGYTKADRLRLWTSLYKRDRGCQSCGESDPSSLQFHHENGDKTRGVGAMISDSYPTEEVLAEVKKCTVLCANCHRKTHRR